MILVYEDIELEGRVVRRDQISFDTPEGDPLFLLQSLELLANVFNAWQDK